MPIYEYRCNNCGRIHEIFQKITDSPLSKCPICGGSLIKLISNCSFQLKGTGWYLTDYARKGNKESKKEQKKETTSSSKKTKSKEGESASG